MPFALTLLFVACGPAVDSAAPAEEVWEFETDLDRDGFPASEDCDDVVYETYPGASELCDGADNDCDGETDEGFDADADGYTDAGACADGNDCDDDDATSHPGGEDTPYDGVDQDCVGGDDDDLDGDGSAGGPNGADCDDGNSTLHPDAMDLAGDGIDADCDGEDVAERDLGSAAFWIDGLAGERDYLGFTVDLCDLDDDGLADLVVTAPFGDDLHGQVGIWFAEGQDRWAATMDMSDSDTLITTDSYWLGFGIACGDVDGDGEMDLVVGRGDGTSSNEPTDFGLVILYGDGSWPATMVTEDDAVELSLAVGSSGYYIGAQPFSAGDIDGDGAAEVLLVNPDGTATAYGDDALWVLPGARYTVDADLDEVVDVRLVSPVSGELSDVLVAGDVDGDGVTDVLLGLGGHIEGGVYRGAAAVLDAPQPGDTWDDVAWGSVLSPDEDTWLGGNLAVGDFAGGGAIGAALSAHGDTTGGNDAGAVFFYGDLGESFAGADLDATSAARGVIYGDDASAYLGWELAPVADLDGDGADELLVSAPGAGAGGEILLIAGGRVLGETNLADATLIRWSAESVDGLPGNGLASGDIDGDGLPDFVVAAPYQDTSDGDDAEYSGRVYVELTGSW